MSSEVLNQPPILTDGQKIKAYLSKNGIRHNHFAKVMGGDEPFDGSWATHLFNGRLNLNEKHKARLKEVYPNLYNELYPEQ